jgi:hypothetical protein
MLKKTALKENEVVCIKVDEGLFTLGQMRKNGIMQFFDISNSDCAWQTLDLNSVRSIFYLFVADKALQPIFLGKVDANTARPSTEAIPRKMLFAVIGNAGNHGADLIELTDDYSSYGATVLQRNLDPEADLAIIHQYELSGMYGNPAKLQKRLQRYFSTGVNWDDTKSYIFKDIALPAASR